MDDHKQLNTFHLFAGAGGGILADLLLGHNPIGACEIEQYPRDVLLARQRDGILPNFPIWDDVCTLDGNPWRGTVDVLAGGFPCQDISSAGKGAGISGERSGLWKEYARLIDEMRPKFVFAENSPLLRTRGLGVVLKDLAALGYHARWGVLGARDVGASHKRDRMWVLAYAKGERYWARGKTRNISEKNGRQVEQVRSEPSSAGKAAAHLAYTECKQDNSERRVSECRRNTVGREKQAAFGEDWQASANSVDGQSDAPEMANANSTQRKRTRQPCGSYPKDSYLNSSSAWWGQDPAEVSEPFVGRMVDGVANRVDRLKAIGNGQVPQCAALAFNILSRGLI